jgi:hypothetical protein
MVRTSGKAANLGNMAGLNRNWNALPTVDKEDLHPGLNPCLTSDVNFTHTARGAGLVPTARKYVVSTYLTLEPSSPNIKMEYHQGCTSITIRLLDLLGLKVVANYFQSTFL